MDRKKLFVDHIVLTVKDLQRSLKYYTKVFGKPDGIDSFQFWFKIAQTKLFIVLPLKKLPKNDAFNPNRIGLEHLAFGIKKIQELKEIEKHLNKQKIIHSGIHIDNHSNKEKIWLNDPDGIRIEFFLRK